MSQGHAKFKQPSAGSGSSLAVSPVNSSVITPSAAGATRIVLDTQIWLDLLWFAEPQLARLDPALLDGRLSALADPATRDEWLRVVSSPRMGIAEVDQLHLQREFDRRTLLCPAHPALPGAPRPHIRCKDPDDQMFIDLALREHAKALISRDKAVLACANRARRLEGLHILAPTHLDPLLDGRLDPAEG